VTLSNGQALVHWRRTWTGHLDFLPHDPLAAAGSAALLIALLPVGVFVGAAAFGKRWIAKPAVWKALIVVMLIGPALAFSLIWGITHLTSVVTAGAGAPQDIGAWLTVAAAVAAIMAVAYAIGIIFWPKTRAILKGFFSHGVIQGCTAMAVAVTVLGAAWSLDALLLVLQPAASGPGFISRHWPEEPVRSAAVAAAWVFFLFLFVFAATRGFHTLWPGFLRAAGSLLLAVTAGAATAFGVFWIIGTIVNGWPGDFGLWHAVAYGTPMVLAAFSLVIVVQLGFLGAHFPDEQREWWSRLRAWTLIYSVAWTTLFTLAIYSPLWLAWLMEAADGWGGFGAGLLWVASTIAGIKTGGSAETANSSQQEIKKPLQTRIASVVALVAPYIFIGGLLVLISAALQQLIDPNWTTSRTRYWEILTHSNGELLMLAAFLLILFSVIVSWRIGVNEFSMHHFYKNRLVRCYLGASHWRDRKPDWFTGFDSSDDMPLSSCDRDSATQEGESAYSGPYPIINAALNLVAGQDLAWQERKATSFVFTPKYCGYDVDRAVLNKEQIGHWPDAYAPTSRYVHQGRGVMLGTATAISGAAANPNMGKATSPASAFLMTIFNVRLGWWLPNTRRIDVGHAGPPLGVTYTAVELFGMTDDEKKYVNVSDGGHFENLGVYELIRRGCKYIIACDAGQDSSFGLEDLGNLIRKCRTDFGVEIDIGLDPIRNRDQRGWSAVHCVVGRIKYLGVPASDDSGKIRFDKDGVPECEEGLLLYIKPSITGDEPFDVLEYFKRVPEFPHESTADQWFNESQFESYRCLGIHITDKVFRRYREDENKPLHDPAALFEQLHSFWRPPSPVISQYSTAHTLEYSRLMELVRSKPAFSHLDSELFPDLNPDGPHARDRFYICNSLIQLMENVYADIDLEQNYDHPHVRGWMSVFKTWANQPAFEETWTVARCTYADRFRNFYEDRLMQNRKLVKELRSKDCNR
jgi:hypothetical protein